MYYAETYIREAHACDILAESHSLSSFGSVCNRAAQRLGDNLDCLEVEHIRELPSALGDVAFDCVGKCVHTRCGGQTLGHCRHHFGVDYCNYGDIVGVYAHELSILLYVGYNVVYGNFCRRACRGGYGDYRNGGLFGINRTLEASYVLMLGVGNYYAYCLGRIHGRAAADCYYVVCAALLECRNARLHVFNRGVGLNVGIQLVCIAVVLEYLEYLVGYVELYEVGVGAHECLLKAALSYFVGYCLNSSCAVIACLVQYKPVH